MLKCILVVSRNSDTSFTETHTDAEEKLIVSNDSSAIRHWRNYQFSNQACNLPVTYGRERISVTVFRSRAPAQMPWYSLVIQRAFAKKYASDWRIRLRPGCYETRIRHSSPQVVAGGREYFQRADCTSDRRRISRGYVREERRDGTFQFCLSKFCRTISFSLSLSLSFAEMESLRR